MSIRSNLIIWALRNRHLFQGKMKAEIVDENFSVDDFRSEIDNVSAKHGKLPKGVSREEVDIDGIYGEWLTTNNTSHEKVILYIHGGGFISGSCLTHRRHVAKFVEGSGVKALLFDYRLAPEHPFPAALEDSVKAYLWLLENGYSNENIILAGESAGGTLVLTLLIALRDKGIDLPKATVSISPVTDLSCLADSFKSNAVRDIAPIGSWDLWTGYYIGSTDYKEPWLSPQYADLTGLSPVKILVGSHEIHLDDATNFAEKAKAFGVDVDFKVWDKMIHAFPILSPMFPEAKEAMSEICRYISNKLNV